MHYLFLIVHYFNLFILEIFPSHMIFVDFVLLVGGSKLLYFLANCFILLFNFERLHTKSWAIMVDGSFFNCFFTHLPTSNKELTSTNKYLIRIIY